MTTIDTLENTLTNPTQGLTSAEAAARLAQFGPNEPAPRRKRSGLVRLLALFLNPLVVILLTAAIASALLGELIDACIIVTVVLLGVAINFVQTYRSQRAAERLREQVTPTATVLRDGNWREIRRRELVPGDLIRLSAEPSQPTLAWWNRVISTSSRRRSPVNRCQPRSNPVRANVKDVWTPRPATRSFWAPPLSAEWLRPWSWRLA